MHQFREAVWGILDQLGLGAESIAPAEIQGVANETWLCGRWVVRISKDPEYLEDLFTESVAVPAAMAAGVPTPRPVHFCLKPTDGRPPFSVFERVQAVPLSSRTQLADPERFFSALGSALRTTHAIRSVADPGGYLDESWTLSAEELRADARRLGLLAEVEPLLRAATADPSVFVHQDLHADNLLVDERERPVLIDWGDAGFGDPAVDFRFIPAQYIGAALRGYGPVNPDLEARIKLHVFEQFARKSTRREDYGPLGESEFEALVGLLARD